jgi:hypothetical protein
MAATYCVYCRGSVFSEIGEFPSMVLSLFHLLSIPWMDLACLLPESGYLDSAVGYCAIRLRWHACIVTCYLSRGWKITAQYMFNYTRHMQNPLLWPINI